VLSSPGWPAPPTPPSLRSPAELARGANRPDRLPHDNIFDESALGDFRSLPFANRLHPTTRDRYERLLQALAILTGGGVERILRATRYLRRADPLPQSGDAVDPWSRPATSGR
jgi:hypothetical protein